MDEAEKLAKEHWAFLQRWMGMVFKDGFIHGYKHGQENSAPRYGIGTDVKKPPKEI